MSVLSKMQGWLLGKPKTSDYRQFPLGSFRQPRDLPVFSFETIRDMLIDPTVRLGLAMRAAPLSQVEFAFKSKGEWVPGVQADRPDVAKFVERQLKRIWKHELHKILAAQVWGWSAGEVTFRLVNKKVEVDGFLHRFAGDVFALQKDGQTKGVRFDRLGVGTKKVNLRFPKSFWHAFDPESESPYGTSILKGALSPWADKWLNGGALDVRRLFMHKDAYGGMVISYPPGTLGVKSDEVPNRDTAREMVEQAKAGEVITMPSVFDPNSNQPLWKLEWARLPGSPQHILDYPKDLDVEMLRGMEIPDDVLTSEGSGAWQGKQVPMLAFYVNADRWLAQAIRGVVTQQLEPLVLINWGRPEEFEVTTKPLAEQAMEQMRAAEGQQGDPQDGQQQSRAQQNSAGPLNNVRGPNGNVFQRRNRAFGRQRLGLDDSTMAELMVGQGVVDTAELVEAGRRFLSNGGIHYMAVKHAPKGGLSIGGKKFTGGQFIPGDVLAKATEAEKAKLNGNGSAGEKQAKESKADGNFSEQVNSTEFKKWFGDSKAVNEDGSPLIVHHGTQNEFTTFDKARIGSSLDPGDWGAGFYFASRGQAEFAGRDRSGKGKKGNVLSVALAIQNPFTITGDRNNDELHEDHPAVPALRSMFGEVIDEAVELGLDLPAVIRTEIGAKRFTEVLQENGFDGFHRKFSDKNEEWVAFEPNQIKSATGNLGEFDPDNPDIRMAMEKRSDLEEC